MEVTLLGTGAPLHPERATLGILVRAPGCEPLLIDTCGGMEIARQLALIDFGLDQLRNVVVTHRHMDHAGGVPALMLARLPLTYYATDETQAALGAMMQASFAEWRVDGVTHTSVKAGGRHEIGGFEVELFGVEHRVETVAVRVSAGGRTFAFSADSVPCEALVDCARGADLFLCDAIWAGVDQKMASYARDIMHPTSREAGEMAARADVGALGMVHLGRYAEPAVMLEEARAAFGGRLGIPDDGERYEL